MFISLVAFSYSSVQHFNCCFTVFVVSNCVYVVYFDKTYLLLFYIYLDHGG